MAAKKTRKSLDSLRGDIQELAESFAAFRDLVESRQAAAAAERERHGMGSGSVSGMHDVDAPISASGISHVSMSGHYETMPDTGELGYAWSLDRTPLEDLLTFPIEQHAQRLAAIGHSQRLGIALMLLKKPATANDVVTALSLGTTGAAYHHLNVLQAAGFVEQRQRGIFSLVSNQIAVLLTILSALSNTISVDTCPLEKNALEEDHVKAPVKKKKHHA